jgi:hypothetical protein
MASSRPSIPVSPVFTANHNERWLRKTSSVVASVYSKCCVVAITFVHETPKFERKTATCHILNNLTSLSVFQTPIYLKAKSLRTTASDRAFQAFFVLARLDTGKAGSKPVTDMNVYSFFCAAL